MAISKENEAQLKKIEEQGQWNNFDGVEIAVALTIGLKGGDIAKITNEGEHGDTLLVIANAEGCLNLLTGIFMGADELSWRAIDTNGERMYEVRAWWD